MIKAKSANLKQTIQQFKALGDPTRLQILALLANSEFCVCDLQSNIQVPANLLSHHLKVLREAGLIIGKKRGRWIDYKLNEQALELLKASLPPSLELAEIEGIVACETLIV